MSKRNRQSTKITLERSFSVVRRFLFLFFLLCFGCVADLFKKSGDPTVVPLVRSQFRVFHPPEKHAWSQQSGFPTNYFIIPISNTSITPPEFFNAWKSHISIEILHQNQNQIVSNSTFHNSRIPPTVTLTSHFFSAFIRSFGFPPTSPQTENFQYLQHHNQNKNLIVRNSTLPNSQTPQSADFTRHPFSKILSSTISHHHVNSTDVKPCNYIGPVREELKEERKHEKAVTTLRHKETILHRELAQLTGELQVGLEVDGVPEDF